MAKKYCPDCNIKHSSLMCWFKPRLPIKPKAHLTWQQTKDKWRLANPPNKRQQWECYLQISPQCPKVLTITSLILDHVKSRSSHPELKYDLRNLRACCWWCNSLKGSKSLENLAKDYPKVAWLV